MLLRIAEHTLEFQFHCSPCSAQCLDFPYKAVLMKYQDLGLAFTFAAFDVHIELLCSSPTQQLQAKKPCINSLSI